MTRITVPRVVLILIALISGFWLVDQVFRLVYRIADILLIFGLAWLLRLLLDPLVRRLRQLHINRGVSIAIAYLLFIGVFVAIIAWSTPQITEVAQGIPGLVRLIAARVEQVAIWLQQRGVRINPEALTGSILNLGSQMGSDVARQAFTFAQDVLNFFGKFALVLTVSIYLSAASGELGSWLRPVIPPRWRDEYDSFLIEVNNAYSSSIRSYFYVVLIGTLISAAILFGFQVPGAFLWIVIVFALRLLPFIGGTLADIVTVLALIIELPIVPALIATGVVVIAQIVLTNVLMPRVFGRELGINPLLVLFSVLLGARIYGVAGVLFAIPAASVIATISGRAINRYLRPMYERSGWWQEEVTVAQRHDAAPEQMLDLPRPSLKEVT